MLYHYDHGTMATKDRYGQVALHLATLRGKLECVEWLLEGNKNSPKAANQTGATAIHFAAALS
jgi:ankyrin repeat protein